MNASPHIRKNAMPHPMKRLVPAAPTNSARWRLRANASATEAT